MVQHHTLCFIIADGGQARLVQPAADNALHTIETLESDSQHKQTSDLVSDRAGRTHESASPTRHAVAPHSDPHELEKVRFAHVVGEHVNQMAGRFTGLVLVAPSHVLAEMMGMLNKPATAKIVGTLAKDLVKVPDHELYPHLKQWVRPTHRQ